MHDENEPKNALIATAFADDDGSADRALVKALRGRKGRLTKADAVALSGLPRHAVDSSLERLLGRYRSRLEVTDDGELLYSFDPAMVRRDEATLAEKAKHAAALVGRAGMWLFKGWITVTLVAYVLAFVALIIGMMMGDDRRRDDRRGGDGLGWLLWFMLPDGYGPRYQSRDPWGRSRSGQRHGLLGDGRPKKKLVSSVFDFVFGPARPAADPLADERDILAWLRRHGGRMTTTDLVRLFGWSYHKAEEEMTKLLVAYGGEPEVTEDGVIIYSFPELLKSANEATALATRGDVRMAWQRAETRPALTGNTTGTDVAVAGFAGFNLVASFFAADWAADRYGLVGPMWTFWLTAFPMAFFSIFMLIPASRLVARRIADRGRDQRNRRRELVKAIVDGDGALDVASHPGLTELTLAFQGEPDVDLRGNAIIKFERPVDERTALASHLRGVDLDREKKVGAVIFGGADVGLDDDEPDALPPASQRQLH